MKMERCYFCRGPIVQRRIEHVHRWKGRMFLIKDLPADVCEQCGETYLSPEVMERIDQVVERSEMATEFISVPVLSLA
ncbi:MAG: type II toxin-antitoxin system MqsA family antitoxin [bacterium]|uniref:Type II toxin-antitoxin system MqsA family antitoxin n=1 Tax=Candidatus Methylomirabilis tolerans TaxID=3123416 RepID=A0AAJ1AHJ8_9BACT|nr:type II toxin-antitoxin system MqsA family antitoxin [Candidatus Methylomirabilis sp.]